MHIDKDGEARAFIHQSGGAWDVVIGGPWVDPCLMVCFMAIVSQSTTTKLQLMTTSQSIGPRGS
jgi:hypothetical protein